MASVDSNISNQVSPANDEWVFPLEHFLDELRNAQFFVSPDHYYEVQVLISTIVPEHSFENLESLLCPLFAQNAEDQKRFSIFFKEYFKIANKKRYKFEPEPGIKEEIKKDISKTDEKSETEDTSNPLWKTILTYGFVAIILIICSFWAMRFLDLMASGVRTFNEFNLFAGLFFYIIGASLSFGVSNLIITGFNKLLKYKAPKSFEARLIALSYILLLIITLFFSSHITIDRLLPVLGRFFLYLVAFFLVIGIILAFSDRNKKSNKKDFTSLKFSRKAPIRFLPKIVLPSTDILSKTESLQINRTLSRMQFDSYNTEEIDVERTIEQTTRNAGIIDIVFERANVRPTYLLLIDQAEANKHQIEWFDYILRLLQEDGTAAQRYFYHSDPSQVWSENEEDSVALATLYSGQRLLLLSKCELFSDVVSGGIKDWVLDLFSLWTEKAILTPKPIEEWGYNEQELYGEFVMVPASIEGLLDSVGHFDELSEKGLDEWHEENAYDVYNTDDIELIRDHLSAETFDWVCACALYPDLYWKLTLQIGFVLEENYGTLLNKEEITLVSRLKWFQEGKIPGKIRVKLIEQLSRVKELKVRNALIDILKRKESIPPTDSYAFRNYQFNLWRNEFEVTENELEKKLLFFKMQRLFKEQKANDFEIQVFLQQENLLNSFGFDFEGKGQLKITRSTNIPRSFPLLFNTARAKRTALGWVLFDKEGFKVYQENLRDLIEESKNILLVLSSEGVANPGLIIEASRKIYLKRKYDLILVFQHSNLKESLAVLAQNLNAALEEFGQNSLKKKLSIISELDSGLIARYFIEQLRGAALVKHLILLDTPNLGMEEKWQVRILSFFNLKGVMDSVENSSFMNLLQESDDPKVPYSILVTNWKDNKDAIFSERSIKGINEKWETAAVIKEVDLSHEDLFIKEEGIQAIHELLEREIKVTIQEFEFVQETTSEIPNEEQEEIPAEAARFEGKNLDEVKSELREILSQGNLIELLDILYEELNVEAPVYEVMMSIQSKHSRLMGLENQKVVRKWENDALRREIRQDLANLINELSSGDFRTIEVFEGVEEASEAPAEEVAEVPVEEAVVKEKRFEDQSLEERKDFLRNFIVKDRLDQLFNNINDFISFESPILNDWLLVQYRYQATRRNEMQGLINEESIVVNFNQIRRTALALIDQLLDSDFDFNLVGRIPTSSKESTARQIRRSIQEGRLDQAMREALGAYEKEYNLIEELISLQNRFEDGEDRNRKGVISWEEYTTGMVRIVQSLLELVDRSLIDEEPIQQQTTQSSFENIPNQGFANEPASNAPPESSRSENAVSFEEFISNEKEFKNLIAQAEIEECLNLLERFPAADEKKRNELIIIKARFNQFRKNELSGVLTGVEIDVERNQINMAILNYIDNAEPKDFA